MIRVMVTGAAGRMGQAVVQAVTDAEDMHLIARVDPALSAGGDSDFTSVDDAIAAAAPEVAVLRLTIELRTVRSSALCTPAAVGAWFPVIVEKSTVNGLVSAKTPPPACVPPEPDTVLPVTVEFTRANVSPPIWKVVRCIAPPVLLPTSAIAAFPLNVLESIIVSRRSALE
jgi:NAD(P)-dependent dehydrogenase (short-subunit alcohol dehydrogenase family)